MSDRHEVVGKLWTGRPHAVLYSGARELDLGAPHGFIRSTAWSINDSGTILVEAWNGSNVWKVPHAWFAIKTRGSSFRWTRFRAPRGYSIVQASQIASNGDIAGTVHAGNESGSRSRAALWRPKPTGTGYRATLLPLTSTYSRSEAAAIFSEAGRTLVAGSQGSAHALSLWANRGRMQLRVSPLDDGAGLSVTAVGGTGNHVFLGGVEGDGFDTLHPWVAALHFGHGSGAASVGSVSYLSGAGGLVTSLNGVSAGRQGHLVGVGTTSGGRIEGVVWHGENSVRRLQRLIRPGSPWKLTYATAVNRDGDIAGTGTFHGHSEGYLLVPRKPSRSA